MFITTERFLLRICYNVSGFLLGDSLYGYFLDFRLFELFVHPYPLKYIQYVDYDAIFFFI